MKTKNYVVVMGRECTLLSTHFCVSEFVHSSTADSLNIDNTMQLPEYENAKTLCWEVLEKIRAHYGRRVFIKSGFRCSALNIAVRGARTSQHMSGKAVDVVVEGVSNEELFEWIKSHIKYDQVILEPSWVHVSYNGRRNRGESLIYKIGGYVKG